MGDGLQFSPDEQKEYCDYIKASFDCGKTEDTANLPPPETCKFMTDDCMELLQTTLTPTASCECHEQCYKPDPEPCKDMDGGEVDRYLMGCSDYSWASDNGNDWCDERDDTDTFNSVQMCCACGGGYLAPYATCTPEAVIQCAGNFGSYHACCNQHCNGLGSGYQYFDCRADVELQWQCPRSMPTCVNYVYGKHWGTCE